jgi:hypothetical protein
MAWESMGVVGWGVARHPTARQGILCRGPGNETYCAWTKVQVQQKAGPSCSSDSGTPLLDRNVRLASKNIGPTWARWRQITRHDPVLIATNALGNLTILTIPMRWIS